MRVNLKLYIVLLAAFTVSGCGNAHQTEISTTLNESIVEETPEPSDAGKEAEEFVKIYQEIYENAVETNAPGSLELVRNIVKCLGESGYVAVDSKNQIDMTESEQVKQFCECVEKKEDAALTIIEVSYLGGFTKYVCSTKAGNVDIVQEYYQYDDGQMQNRSTGSYQADSWEYTAEGYLMFSGTCFSKEQYVLTLSDAEKHVAFRVEPLDEVCRELNRQYLLPIGYAQNNMFLEDWNEADFGNLNFYDLYDILYPKVNGAYVPYTMDDNLSVGTVYQIPKDEFEGVLMTYFNVTSGALQSKTTYYAEDAAYEYRPRGFYEVEFPKHPYPEVVAFTESDDGTITLMVNVVFPYEGISKVYAHEVVVRPLEDGGVQYVSNRVLPSVDNYEETWHTPRLTKGEWEEVYGRK